jgi:hypothetical protein
MLNNHQLLESYTPFSLFSHEDAIRCNFITQNHTCTELKALHFHLKQKYKFLNNYKVKTNRLKKYFFELKKICRLLCGSVVFSFTK